MSHRPRPFTELASGWTFRRSVDDIPVEVTLPHSWNAYDTLYTDPASHFWRGVGIYEHAFRPPPIQDVRSRRLWLNLGAVAQRGCVYFDNERLATHHGGYTAFTVELPDRPGTLRIEADNRPDINLIPSDLSDFFLHGGVTRPIYLEQTGAVRLIEAFFDLDTTADRGQITLRGKLDGAIDAPLSLSVQLTAPDNEKVFIKTFTVEKAAFRLSLPDVERPRLWSPDDPALYTAIVTLADVTGVVDEIRTQIGFRWFDFPKGGPFLLNGERLLLKGTHRHDDYAEYGAAVPYDLIQQEMEQIKAAGFNFIRLGHYPQDDFVLHLCDKLGFIVWEELPWCRGGLGGETFKNHARTMLWEMIVQHYNRPSVVFWGLGNELDWESEHPDSDDDKVATFLRELHDHTHELDPKRLTALRRFEPGAAIVDVYSPSIWSGWYRGRYMDYEVVLQQAIKRYPRLLHIEWGGDSHAGRHNDGPHITKDVRQEYDHGEVPGLATSDDGFARYSKDGDWSESYIIDLMAHHLMVQARQSHLAGTAQWVFKDFSTPLRPENPVPYVNQKGLVTRDGTPKDVYYVFQAFQSSTPTVRIESSAWPLRVAPSGTSHRIRVITNCDVVELYIDGVMHSRQRRMTTPAGIMTWEVSIDPGVHTFAALGYTDGLLYAQHEIQQTIALGNCAPVTGLETTVDELNDDLRLGVQLVDAQLRPVTNDERVVRFIVQSGGNTVCGHGVMGGSDVVETANGYAWVRLKPKTSPLTVHIQVNGLPLVEKVIHHGSHTHTY